MTLLESFLKTDFRSVLFRIWTLKEFQILLARDTRSPRALRGSCMGLEIIEENDDDADGTGRFCEEGDVSTEAVEAPLVLLVASAPALAPFSDSGGCLVDCFAELVLVRVPFNILSSASALRLISFSSSVPNILVTEGLGNHSKVSTGTVERKAISLCVPGTRCGDRDDQQSEHQACF